MQLSEQEKDQLYSIISAIIGEDAAIHAARSRFTDDTVSVVEDMLVTNMNCNESMKLLVGENALRRTSSRQRLAETRPWYGLQSSEKWRAQRLRLSGDD